MNARLGHNRQDRNMVHRQDNNSDSELGQYNFPNSDSCTSNADCPLLCQDDDASMDCSPLTDSQRNRFSLFRTRSSARQTPRMNRLESSISITSLNACMPHMEERMRRRLKYFFMNPCQKYQAKRRKPFKLVIQIIKIALVTAQLNIFGTSNQMLVDFKNENEDVFSSRFFARNQTYYGKKDVYWQIYDIRHVYATWKNTTVGIYDYPTRDISERFSVGEDIHLITAPEIKMCVSEYSQLDVGSNSVHYNFNMEDSNETCFLTKIWDKNESYDSTLDHVPLENGSPYRFDFMRFISIDFYLDLVTMQVKTPAGFTPPICFNISIVITLSNQRHSGSIVAHLSSNFHMTDCQEDVDPPVNSIKILLNVFDSIIILTCMLSLVLCARSLWKAQFLRKNFEKFFQSQYNKELSFSDKMEFFNMWYLLIIISDILTILGSLSKMILQNRDTGIVDYNLCSVFLGVGCLCVWVGVLRYAGFFHKYNILVLTLKKSLPRVCRFMVCASLLYLGFMFCGWVVLGPHHHKFRSLVVTSEALFSLINGDDMYMTFEEMSKRSTAMVVFSQIYLYTFISLFIYVVLSLFIAVIMDTYETIKDWQEGTEPQQSELEKFIAPCTVDVNLENYGFDGLNAPTRCCCCCFPPQDEDFYTDDDVIDD